MNDTIKAIFAVSVLVLLMFGVLIMYKNRNSLIDGSCNHFSNSTHDMAIDLPFSKKCMGFANYISDNEVRRGIVIR